MCLGLLYQKKVNVYIEKGTLETARPPVILLLVLKSDGQGHGCLMELLEHPVVVS